MLNEVKKSEIHVMRGRLNEIKIENVKLIAPRGKVFDLNNLDRLCLSLLDSKQGYLLINPYEKHDILQQWKIILMVSFKSKFD